MKNVAVIGAGTMGNGIAHTFAQNDYKVQLIDVSQASLDRGMATITKNLDRMVAKERISEEDKQRTLKNLTMSPGGLAASTASSPAASAEYSSSSLLTTPHLVRKKWSIPSTGAKACGGVV